VGDIAAPDCVLFLWATAPMLPQALEVMAAWGFTYKSHIVWRKAEPVSLADPVKGVVSAAKLVLGTGYWFRNGHELLLVGTRGEVPAPAMGDQWGSIVDAAPLKHSQKPDWAIELIETYFPNLPKIELNARTARAGWDAWGLEAPDSSAGQPPPLTPPRTGEGDTAAGDHQPIRRDDLVDAAGGDPNTPPAGARSGASQEGASAGEATRPADTSVDGGEAVAAGLPATNSVAADLEGTVTGGGEGGAGAGGALPDPLSLYRSAVEAGAAFAGRHTQATIEPILRAGVAAQVTGAQMAMDTDSKLGSILGWKAKLKLTGLGSGRAAPRPRVQGAAE
jgi:N6-adenosine-specific RNA methylase IME4